MGFLVVLRFLTILPVPLRREITDKGIGQSLPFFPLVGLLLGAILYGLYYGLALILPLSVVVALLVVALAILTGGHHLDGLGDTFDGMGAGKSREERLAIMSDPHTGTFGVVAVVLVLLLKYALLSSTAGLAALLSMTTLSRWMMVNVLFMFPYARKSGMGLAFKQGSHWLRLIAATVITLAVSFVILQWWGVVLMAVVGLVMSSVARYFSSRLGGLTGDTYGAINELSEVLVLILLLIINR
ncbi:MAG: adenosylcobinamide-GDP ribazoletransferase [Chloroflexi bacterium]|nr:adenosylcobinamide-GDP ribazoletransferase [Chloroflexota bacterium]